MGRRRARSGHPEPYGVVRWEIGNELAGHHQRNWSTPRGYADRYRRFRAAMLAADPSLTVYATGSQILHGDDWNHVLYPELARTGDEVTDHPLAGALIESQTDPVDVYRDFMAYPLAYERRHRRMAEEMRAAGVENPIIAITELQEHAKLAPPSVGSTPLIGPDTMVNPRTLSEALYATLFFHAAARLSSIVELITHSATVNHGGGLRTERERVYCCPVHHAATLCGGLEGFRPVSTVIATPHSLCQVRVSLEAAR